MTRLLLLQFVLLIVMGADAFNYVALKKKNTINIERKSNVLQHNNKLKMSLLDQIPLPVLVLCSGALVFGIFNVNINVDLTDEGIAKAKLQRRKDRIARGEVLPKKNEDDKDPYRYKWFEEEDDDELLQIVEGRNKKGGGCG